MAPRSEANKQALRDSYDAAVAPNDHMTCFKVMFDNFEIDPAASRTNGIEVELVFNFLRQIAPHACNALRAKGGGHASAEKALRYNRDIFEIIGRHHFNVNRFTFADARVHKQWYEVDNQGRRTTKEGQFPILPLRIRPNRPLFQPFNVVTPTPLPLGVTVRISMNGFLEHEVGTVTTNSVRNAVNNWNTAKLAAARLIQASTGLQNVQWQGDIAWPRDEGLTPGMTLGGWQQQVRLNRYLQHVAPAFTPLLAPFTRVDVWLDSQFFAQPVPANDYHILHFSDVSFVLQTAKTFAAISDRYVQTTGGDGTNIEFSFGTFGDPGHPAAREIHLNLKDQRLTWKVSEAALMWQQGRDRRWPLTQRRLVNMGFSVDRARYLHNLTQLIGTRTTRSAREQLSPLSEQSLSFHCAVLVAFNSLLQIVLFAPLSIFYIHVLSPNSEIGEHRVQYAVVAKSVAVFLGIPLAAAMALRGFFMVLRLKSFYQNKFLPAIAPLSLISLLFAIIIIFAGQGKQVVSSITNVLRIIPPLLIYFLGAFFLTLWGCKRFGSSYQRSTVHAFTNASNNFELAIAVAIASYGAQSDQALAATVGPLVEVPVLVTLAYLLVWYRKRTRWDLPSEAGSTYSTEKEGSASKEPEP
ncbi:uncharacterized protein JCM6883_005623 [Sporobolomyces salmoneus]|uniref:uncharacterized protein n=1 Tax=Sporobolomyces salmoneus TaxID=183962 RepID=UPI00317CBE3A